ncbi:hypothetical protein LAUMK35_05354 [Mycobacterium pseudokansasii]|nr:hypothetical protein LAUMK35_05354 [Mycobacterium pseudokansasii]
MGAGLGAIRGAGLLGAGMAGAGLLGEGPTGTGCMGTPDVDPPPAWVALAASAAVYELALNPKALTNCSWISWASALIAWYSWPYAAKLAAVTIDTSSAAAGITPVMGSAAVTLAVLTPEPIACSRPTAAISSSGSVITTDMWFLLLLPRRLSPAQLVPVLAGLSLRRIPCHKS